MEMIEMIKKLGEKDNKDKWLYISYEIWTEISKENILAAINVSWHTVEDIESAYDKYWEIIITFKDWKKIELGLELTDPEYKYADNIEFIK